jgi:outer membrane receptor protein involved in Fe transport
MHRPLLVPALTFLLFALCSSSAVAQVKGSLSGRVVDQRTNHAIAFANVAVVGAQRGGLTDSEGQYLITGVPLGTYEVSVRFLGYRPENRAGVTVAAGKPTVVNFELSEIVVQQEKAVEVTAERRLVEVKQGTTVRSVSASEIRNLPVQTIGDVLQRQAGISTDADQIHIRGGRADETIFVINGVTNRDLVTGQSTAGQINARSVAEVNVATGAYDVRYGNALSGVVEVRLKEGGDKLSGGMTTTAGSYGGRAFQLVIGGPDPVWTRLLRLARVRLPGTVTSILDVSGSLYNTRYRYLDPVVGRPIRPPGWKNDYSPRMIVPTYPTESYRLRSSYEDSFFGERFHYSDRLSPSADNRWALRYGLTWKPSVRDKWTFDFSKRIAIDQGFSRTFITARGDQGDPTYPWQWAHRIRNAPTIFEDNVQNSLSWRRSLDATGYTELHFSRYFFAQRQDVMGKLWWDFAEGADTSLYTAPDDKSYFDTLDVRRSDYFYDSGDDNTWQDRRTTTYELQGIFLKRIKRHELEVGFDHQSQAVQYATIEEPWVEDLNRLGASHDVWSVHPWVGNLFARDRLDYEGFTGNIGIRADYWFLGREAEAAIADPTNPNLTSETREKFYKETRTFFGRRYKLKLSPRVIVAHPITQNSSFFFNYGQFTQNPSYRYVYSRLTSVSSESFPLLGNPNLNPQVSVNYELGAKHMFLPTAAANLTFFVKDTYDYPTSTLFAGGEAAAGVTPKPIFVYLNGHFARARGFELEIEKRRSHYWSGKVTYTYQQTKGKSSDPNEQKVVQETGGNASDTRLSETFVSWNRPHKLAFVLDVRFDKTAPLEWLRYSGLNVYVQGYSGRAYTPQNPRTSQAGEPNSKNGPFQVTTDLRFNRSVHLFSRRLDVSAVGINIFSTRLINRIDPVTGRGRVWGVGSYDPVLYPLTRNDNYLKMGSVDDPSNYGDGIQWRFSLDYDF